MRPARAGVGVALAASATLLAAAPAHADGGGVPGSALAGAGAVFTVQGLSRVDGAVRLVATLANRGDGSIVLSQATHYYGTPSTCLAFDLVDPATGRVGHPVGSSGGQCRASRVPAVLSAGQQVTFAVDVADPGGDRLDVLSELGGVVPGVAVSGSGTASGSQDVATLEPRSLALDERSQAGGARVRHGKKTSIDLDADVLFAVDSATLSSRANRTLDRAAAELKKQSGRQVAVSGHTDSSGTPAHNQTLSQQRAAAVQKALAARLGAGWTFQVRGYGETKPLVPEKSATGKVDPAAQALNRRVELAVT